MHAPHSDPFDDPVPNPSPEDVVAAFREVHARSLLGFALLLNLGDQVRAGRLVEHALASGAERVSTLRHPERAAAWLRRRVFARSQRRIRMPRRAGSDPAIVLAPIGAGEAVMHALASLGPRERGALIASDVERLDRRDVATIIDRDLPALERLLRGARARYYRAYAPVAADDVPDGPTVSLIQAIARRQMA